jgi:hypothetical protein
VLAVACLDPGQHRRFDRTNRVAALAVDVQLSAKRCERPQAVEGLGRRDTQEAVDTFIGIVV